MTTTVYKEKGLELHTHGKDYNLYWGPGGWICSHTYAFHCTSLEKMRQFIDFFTTWCKNLPCEGCQSHATKYITDNPMTDYLNRTGGRDKDGDMLAMFEYTVNMHNAVNRRLKKPLYNYDTIKRDYSQHNNVCHDMCMDGIDTSKYDEPVKDSFKSFNSLSWKELYDMCNNGKRM